MDKQKQAADVFAENVTSWTFTNKTRRLIDRVSYLQAIRDAYTTGYAANKTGETSMEGKAHEA